MQKILKNKYLPPLCLSVLIIVSIFMSISYVEASSFAKNSTLFDGIDNSISATDDSYPYSSSSATTNKVSMDIVYGSKKNLVTFHGEVPYAETHSSDGNALSGWSGYYSQPGTYTVDESDPTKTSYFSDTYQNGHSVIDYWGSGITASKYYNSKNFKSVGAAESINKPEVISLRLYALEMSTSGLFSWLGNIFYWIAQCLAGLAAMFVSLVIQAKNINMDIIMDALHLDDVGEMLTKNFIINGASLSPFTGFCIVMFIFALVGYGIRWVKGSDKVSNLWSIIGTAALGVVVIGICLLGKWSDLGSTISDVAAKTMYATTESLSTTGGDAFAIDITDSDNNSYITQLSEISMINKTFIDAQICTQFGVTSIDKLDFSELGVSNSKLLYGSNANDFNNNLGYYFWFADSSAAEKTAQNKTIPKTNAAAAEEKLSSMITALQIAYNNGSDSQKDTIKGIVASFAKPNTATGGVLMLAIVVVMILLGIVLIVYAKNVLIAKLELFVSLLGLVVAGPLILTNNKKLVNTGKSILGMLLISLVEITVWGTFFDIIVYITAVMLEANIIRVLVTIGFLLLFLKFNPYVHDKVKDVLDNTTRTISPEFHQSRNAIKQSINRKVNDVVNKYDESDRFNGYDSNGDPLYEKRKGSVMSMLLHGAANSLERADSKKSVFKIGAEAAEARKEQKNATNLQKRKAAEEKRIEAVAATNADADNIARGINADVNRTVKAAVETDDFGRPIGYNFNHLSDDEQTMALDLRNLEDEEAALMADPEYKELLNEQKAIDEHNANLSDGEEIQQMSQEKLDRLEELQNNIKARRKEIENKKNEINGSIRRRAVDSAARSRKISIVPNENESLDDAISRASKIVAQQEHAEELREALKEEINAHALDSENVHNADGKIGTSRFKVNADAVEKQATATLMLQQLENNEVVDANAVKENAKAITEQIERDSKKVSAKLSDAVSSKVGLNEDQRIADARKRVSKSRLLSKERKEAKEDLDKLLEQKKIADQTKHDQSTMAKAVTNADASAVLGGTVTERINALSKYGSDMDLKSNQQIDKETAQTVKETREQIKQSSEKIQKQTQDSLRQTAAAVSVNKSEIAKKAIKENEADIDVDYVEDVEDVNIYEDNTNNKTSSQVTLNKSDNQSITSPQTYTQPQTRTVAQANVQESPQKATQKVTQTAVQSQKQSEQRHKKIINETVIVQDNAEPSSYSTNVESPNVYSEQVTEAEPTTSAINNESTTPTSTQKFESQQPSTINSTTLNSRQSVYKSEPKRTEEVIRNKTVIKQPTTSAQSSTSQSTTQSSEKQFNSKVKLNTSNKPNNSSSNSPSNTAVSTPATAVSTPAQNTRTETRTEARINNIIDSHESTTDVSERPTDIKLEEPQVEPQVQTTIEEVNEVVYENVPTSNLNIKVPANNVIQEHKPTKSSIASNVTQNRQPNTTQVPKTTTTARPTTNPTPKTTVTPKTNMTPKQGESRQSVTTPSKPTSTPQQTSSKPTTQQTSTPKTTAKPTSVNTTSTKQTSAKQTSTQTTQPKFASSNVPQPNTQQTNIKLSHKTKNAVKSAGSYGGTATFHQEKAAEADHRQKVANEELRQAKTQKQNATSKEDARAASVAAAIARKKSEIAARDKKQATKASNKATKKADKARQTIEKKQDSIIEHSKKQLHKDENRTYIKTDEHISAFEARAKAIVEEQERIALERNNEPVEKSQPKSEQDSNLQFYDDFNVDTSTQLYNDEVEAINDALDTGDFSTLFDDMPSDND